MTSRILVGDVRAVLPTLPDESVHCIVTSPPYWGLRSYLPADHPKKHLEIGSEPTVEKWVETMVGVLRLARRVLRDDGTLWLNLGDSYAGSRCGPGEQDREFDTSTLGGTRRSQGEAAKARAMTSSRRRDDAEIPRSDLRMAGYKPKDLIGQPWMLAFALRADGWWLRQEIIWEKPNPMPESCRDRCTKAHEHVFLLSKRERYYYNFEATQEPVTGGAHARGPGNVRHVKHAESLEADRDGEHRTKGGLVAYAERKRAEKAEKVPGGWDQGEGHHGASHRLFAGNGVGFGHGYDANPKPRVTDEDRRPKAWDVDMGSNRTLVDGYARTMSKPAHNSTAARKARANANTKSAPTDERNGVRALNPKAIAGAEVGHAEGKAARMAEVGIGEQTVDTRNPRSVWTIPTHPFKGAHFATFPPELARRCITAGCPPGGTVLDIFGGSGTVGLVADQLQCNAVLIDLDERNEPMARGRIEGDSSLFAEVAA